MDARLLATSMEVGNFTSTEISMEVYLRTRSLVEAPMDFHGSRW